MYNSVGMQVFNCISNLHKYLFGTIFHDHKVAFLQVVEAIAALHILEDQKEVLIILEKINEPHNVRVLSHFKGFYFHSLQRYGFFSLQ